MRTIHWRKHGLLTLTTTFICLLLVILIIRRFSTTFIPNDAVVMHSIATSIQKPMVQNSRSSVVVDDDLLQFLTFMSDVEVISLDECVVKCLEFGDGNCQLVASMKMLKFALLNSSQLEKMQEKWQQLSADNSSTLFWFIAEEGKEGLFHLTSQRRTYLLSESKFIGDYVAFTAMKVAVLKFPVAKVRIRFRHQQTAENLTELSVFVPAETATFFWMFDRGSLRFCDHLMAQIVRVDHPEQRKFGQFIPDSGIGFLAAYRDLMVKLHMTPILFGGSLLGWYRECGVIAHTEDLDLASPIEEYSPLFLKRLKDDPRFHIHHILGRRNDSFEVAIHNGAVHKAIRIDLFFFYQNGTNGSDWVGGLDVGYKTKYRWNYPPTAVRRICAGDLKGHLMYVPCETVRVLRTDYGVNWATPHLSASFNWKTDHFNVETRGEWSEDDWPDVYKTAFDAEVNTTINSSEKQ